MPVGDSNVFLAIASNLFLAIASDNLNSNTKFEGVHNQLQQKVSE